MSYEVIVVGSCNVDLTSYVDRTPLPGETVAGNEYQMSFGGKGANQAVMAALLGSNVAMVGKVGQDFFGKSYSEHFRSIDISTEFIGKAKPDVSTGTATIVVNKEGQNCIIIQGGANLEVDVKYVRKVLPPLLKKSKILLTQNEIVPEATLEAMKLAREANVITVFNTAPVNKFITDEFYKYTDILCCNEIEVCQLSGVKEEKDNAHLTKAAEVLLKAGCRYVLLTLGDKGARLYSLNIPNGEEVPLKMKVENVVDTTGAGDAFLGSLAYFIVNQLKVDPDSDYINSSIVEKAVISASYTVTSKGAQSSYQEMMETIKRHFSIPL